MNNGPFRLATREEIFGDPETRLIVKNSMLVMYYDGDTEEIVLCKMCKETPMYGLLFILEQEICHKILHKLVGIDVTMAFDNIHKKMGKREGRNVYKFCVPENCSSYGTCFGW